MTQIKPEQIRWRVGQVSKKDAHKGMLLGYIDSRTAMELLDDLDNEWADSYRLVNVGGDEGIECSLTVKGVTRTDVGVPSNTEGLKGAYSDALKRAAVKHGIGRELYELPRIWVTLDDYKRPTVEPTFKGGRWTLPAGSGSVFYDHEPTEQPEQRGPAKAAPTPNAAPVSRSPEEQQLRNKVLELAVFHFGAGAGEAMKRLGDEVGVPHGGTATVEQLHQIIALIETPPGVPTLAADGEAGAETPASPALTMDDVLAATGGEAIWPAPGSEDYKSLPPHEKAKARAWHQEQAVPA